MIYPMYLDSWVFLSEIQKDDDIAALERGVFIHELYYILTVFTIKINIVLILT